MKSKPTQMSVRELRGCGFTPDIVCKTSQCQTKKELDRQKYWNEYKKTIKINNLQFNSIMLKTSYFVGYNWQFTFLYFLILFVYV